MSYQSLLPLLKKSGSTLTPEKFQERINIVFHDFEAEYYDALHNDMKESLQDQMDLLINDLFAKQNISSNELSLLDIGCGTGLSTQILLNSELGKFINQVTLLDTSPNMLKHAEEKAKHWNKKFKLVNSYLSDIDEKFDVILICSVLHHIPDLVVFLEEVENALNPGGIFIHLQDPNGDYLDDYNYLKRKNEYESQINKTSKKSIVDYVPKNIKKGIKRLLNRKDYIDLINDKLIAEKTILKRMTADEIWSVTDIHVETKSDSRNKGISLTFLKEHLHDFELIKMRSYGFFGLLKSALTESYKEKENRLISENEPNGRNIACIWKKK